jgi:exodeoxyribonuclease III
VKIVTWNINSLRARQERVFPWIEQHRPEVVCFQELKLEDADFPTDAYRDLGYHVATLGQKTYNGVAILSLDPLDDVTRGFADGGDESQARFLTATTYGMRVMSAYFPNGQGVGTEKYLYKLAWMKRLQAHLATRVAVDQPIALCGDFNVAPADLDVHDPALWREGIMCSTPERNALEAIRQLGFVDSLRLKHPDLRVFTWWDYRQLSFPKGKGLRIDHLFLTPPLADRLVDVTVDREQRKGKGASDHAPVTAVLRATVTA